MELMSVKSISLCSIPHSILEFGDNLRYAHNLFDQMRNYSDHFLWTSRIRSHVLHGHFNEAITLFAKMHREGILQSGFTFTTVLNACARIPAIYEGKQINARVVQSGHLGNKFVQTSLLDMYAKCGFVRDARDVFEKMVDRDIVAWTAMLYGYTKVGRMEEARWLFDTMGQRNVVSWTTMIAGYANHGNMKQAKELYERMEEKNFFTWVAMIAGYGKIGNVSEARMVFNEIPKKDASCWAAMVVCYSQNGYAKEAIDVYKKIRQENVRVSVVAMVGAISACAQLGDVEMSATLTQHLDEVCCERTLYVSNALIDMHSKCGYIDKAREEFNRMRNRDVFSFTTLIVAFANHGNTKEALDLFSKMQKEGITPNQVTFIGVLNACSHAGLIEEGCRYFELMTQVFCIEPLKEHYACLIDLLGRAGLLEKAYNSIVRNEDATDANIWGSLLAGCKIYGNVELAEIAATHLFEIEPQNTGNFVLLASIYGALNKWDDAERVRKIMRRKGIRKSPACSWILRHR